METNEEKNFLVTLDETTHTKLKVFSGWLGLPMKNLALEAIQEKIVRLEAEYGTVFGLSKKTGEVPSEKV